MKWLAKRRVQEIAIRCIQRNGRAYAKVREWHWWRLYIRVSPLLAATRSFAFLNYYFPENSSLCVFSSVHLGFKFFRCDRENREWEQKLDEKENKIQELRISKNRLEARVVELEQLLVIERGNAQSMNDALEREVEHRLQTEKQLLVLKQRFHGEPYTFHLQ